MELCKPGMSTWEVSCAWAVVSQFLPHNSATLQFQVVINMQMDAEIKKEQIGTLIVWVGALEGWFGGGWSLRVFTVNVPSTHKKTPSCTASN